MEKMLEKFESKIIVTVEFFDYLKLSSNPMFLNIDKKKKNQTLTIGKMNEHSLGLLFLDIPRKGFVKIDSIGALADQLRKYPFIFDEKWDKRAKFIQCLLYP